MQKRITSVALITMLLSMLILPTAFAQPISQAGGITIPVTGTFTDSLGGTGRFVGTFNVQRFVVDGNDIKAVGTLTGTLTNSVGTVLGTIVRTISAILTRQQHKHPARSFTLS